MLTLTGAAPRAEWPERSRDPAHPPDAPLDSRHARSNGRTADSDALIPQLLAIRADMVRQTREEPDLLAGLHPAQRESGRNLLHYLALRRHDLRPLQEALARLGLSSLGRAEAHALASVDAVLAVLHRLAGRTWQPDGPAPLGFEEGMRRLEAHTESLFGPPPPERTTRIMVTMPTETAEDYPLVLDLLGQGMDCMRVNGAHDDAGAWARMIRHLRRAEEATGRKARVLMDLAGPKLRTGPVAPGERVVRVRPVRDERGLVLRPARVWLTPAEGPLLPPPTPADATVPVPGPWLAGLVGGDRIRLVDARGSKRKWAVESVAAAGAWATAEQTAYVVPGTELRRRPAGGEGGRTRTAVGDLPSREGFIPLRSGDLLALTRSAEPGHRAEVDAGNAPLHPATVGCTLPEVLGDVTAGERVWFDDGTIGGVVEAVEAERVLVRITRAGERAKLRADKGINLPDSTLRVAALTEKDVADLPFVAAHADLVALSFANSAEDVRLLRGRLDVLGGPPPAVVLKVETKRGFENLPAMLLEAMRAPVCGVMIARGDLAVECGFERMAEVQEEILRVCEAAHVPVVWATQVLEGLAKDGFPSRAEITDAAMGHRAECVMLNKGPHVVEAVRVLDDILRRMQGHHAKKSSQLRALRLAHVAPEHAVVGGR
jgi:pyruvate kinase